MYRVLISFLIIISSICAKEKTDITLQLNWLNQFQFAGYYMAKEKGFYDDVGLNVTIKELQYKKELVNLIKTGEADFAVGRSSLILNKIRGDDIVALAAIFQDSPLMLLTTNIDEIKTIDDIRNKKVMITPDAEFTASITAMLNSNNIYYEDLQIINHSFNLNDLIEKKTDLMASYISNEAVVLERKNINYRVFHPKDYGFNFYSDILFTSSKFIEENPTTTLRFYEASIKGWEYAFKNKLETANIIYEKYNTQNKPLINLLREGEILEKLAITEDNDQIGRLNKDKLKEILNTFKVLGLTKDDINFDEFIYEKNHSRTLTFELTYEKQLILWMFLFFTISVFLIIITSVNRIHNKRELLKSVINSTDDLIFYKDRRLRYIGCNEAFERYVGLPLEQFIGKDDFELFENKYAKIFRDNDLKVLNTKKVSINEEWLDIEGKMRIFQTKKMPFSYNARKNIGVLGVSRDITTLHEIQIKLEEQTTIDELTKTYNRKLFNERMLEKIEMFKRYESIFCIALFDIDDFKFVNDNYGHDVGDKVLITVCEIIKEHIRNTDMLFRMGGEEFIIMYPKNTLDEALISTENIRTIISKSKILEDSKITISIGLTQVNKNDTVDSMYKRVDELMYFSKKNGKNQTTSN